MIDDYEIFIKKINNIHDIDLSLYKETQMKRRITTLRNKRGFDNFLAYFDELHRDDELLKEFIDRLTINVSEFYRNAKRWEILRTLVIPKLIEKSSRLTIWSAACSTGEEPYSLAILFNEYFPHVNVEILATDIDDGALKKAKEGLYAEQYLKELPVGFKEKYFTKVGDKFKVNPDLRKNIIFKKHNLLADKYTENHDLIVCRNVLIYFTDPAKELIYRGFSDSLRNDGVLFVGSTEQIFSPDKYGFKLLDTFFYQKINSK